MEKICRVQHIMAEHIFERLTGEHGRFEVEQPEVEEPT